MKGRIVIAEDDARQARIVKAYLEREGHSVVVANDGVVALEEFRRKTPDLLILDVMMPNLDGRDVVRIVRAESDVPILMLTALSSEDDQVIGFDLGADDYVTKPYRPRELMARVRALLRRHLRDDDTTKRMERGPLVVDPVSREIWVNGDPVELTASEFEILVTLARSPGRVFTRFELLERTAGFDHDSLERTIDVHIRNIRRKLGDDARDPSHIVTVVGVGYRMPAHA
jgi:DNA-binding response OmpR family regulator